MSGGGTATLGRLDRLDRLDLALGGAFVVGVILTLAVVAIPDFHGHVVAPAADLAFDTVALVVTFAVAALSWVRYRERRQPIALVQAAAFLALAISNVVAVAVAVGSDPRSTASMAAIGESQLFVWAAARVFAAGLLVVGGIESLRGGRPSHPRLFMLGTGALMLVVIGAVLVFGDRLTSLLAHPVPDDRPSEPLDLALTPAGVVVQLAGAVLFLAAAAGGRQLWRRDRVVGDAYLAVGLVVAAFAQVQSTFFPSVHPEQVSTADLLRLVFYVVLLLGIQAEARAMMVALRAANDVLARLRDAEVERAALEERTRLARELHDGLAQDLWLAKLRTSELAAMDGLPDAARRAARDAVAAIDVGLGDARDAVAALRSSAHADSGFCNLIRRTVEDSGDRFGLRVEFTFEGDHTAHIAPRTQAEMLRITQEAMTNVARHAGATIVGVRLTVKGDRITLRVTDNGRGFEMGAVQPGTFGLASMRERAALIGGRLRVASRAGAGTRVVVTAPFTRPATLVEAEHR